MHVHFIGILLSAILNIVQTTADPKTAGSCSQARKALSMNSQFYGRNVFQRITINFGEIKKISPNIKFSFSEFMHFSTFATSRKINITLNITILF